MCSIGQVLRKGKRTDLLSRNSLGSSPDTCTWRIIEDMNKTSRELISYSLIAAFILMLDMVIDGFWEYLSRHEAHIPIAAFCSLLATTGFLFATRGNPKREEVKKLAFGLLVATFLMILGMLEFTAFVWERIGG